VDTVSSGGSEGWDTHLPGMGFGGLRKGGGVLQPDGMDRTLSQSSLLSVSSLVHTGTMTSALSLQTNDPTRSSLSAPLTLCAAAFVVNVLVSFLLLVLPVASVCLIACPCPKSLRSDPGPQALSQLHWCLSRKHMLVPTKRDKKVTLPHSSEQSLHHARPFRWARCG
jgi:hypothetical protein